MLYVPYHVLNPHINRISTKWKNLNYLGCTFFFRLLHFFIWGGWHTIYGVISIIKQNKHNNYVTEEKNKHKNIITIKQQNTYLYHQYRYWILRRLLSYRLIDFFLWGDWHTFCGIITDIICILLCVVISIIKKKSIIIMLLRQYKHKNIATIKQKNAYLYHQYRYWVHFCLLSFRLLHFSCGGITYLLWCYQLYNLNYPP